MTGSTHAIDGAPAAPAGARTGAGDGPGAEPGPVVVGPPPAGEETVRRPARRRGAVLAAAGVLAATALLLWHPWSAGAGNGDDTKDGGSDGSASSPSATGPAAFPTDSVLIRQNPVLGLQNCHSVIARRDPGSATPVRLTSPDACASLPQWSPDRRSFAYTRTTAQGSSLWTADADGSNSRRVLDIAGGRASWSPDGKRLAVLRNQDGVQQLFVVDLADGSTTQLTTGRGQVEDPAWSPDGKRIAVCLQVGKDNWQIHVVDPNAPGTVPQQVTRLPHPALDPVWSPDGRTFAYTAGTYGRGSQGDIRLIGTDGTGDQELVSTSDHEMDPTWSPDGTWLAFVRGPYEAPVVWAVRADGTEPRALTPEAVNEGHPSWR
ncbi:hypothetical protein EF918_35140 [Streptomyces sp. WAC06614]|nr:hypothetical protein EF918_35140 [Streptomyces sp. WAC06614]